MSVKKIWEFTEITSVTPINGSDVVPIGDVSASKTYKSTITNIYNYILNLLNGVFAPIAKGVTNGDSHDHSGGDGAQIDHTTCSNIGTNSHSAIDTFIASKAGSSGLASLDSNSLVIQNPANATSTATANKIPIADTSAKLDTWITTASSSSPGKVQLATSSEAVTGTDTSKAMTPATNYQVALSRIRDTMGKFPGIIPPSLNLFCGEATSDTAPTGTFTRSTTGSRLGQAGLIETVAAGSIRREWDAAGARKGWLVEAIRANVILSSRDLTNAIWTKTNCTAALSQTGIDGAAASASLLTATADVATCLQNITLASSNRFQTAYLKRIAGSGAVSMTMDGGTTWTDITASLSTTAWTRVSIPAQTLANPSVGFRLATSGNAIAVDGVQNETGSYPTSNIATTSAAVARSADVWTMPLSTSWFNTTAGTLFVAGRTAPGVPSSSQNLAVLDDGTFNNRIQIWRYTAKDIYLTVVSGNVVLTSTVFGSLDNDASFRLAISWSSPKFSASLNGGACVTATAAILPSGLTTHRIGSDSAGGNQWGGHISHDAYFPAALTNAQLQAITL